MISDQSLSIYCDGGARGNPGPGASAFVVYSADKQILKDQGVYLGIVTNNQAEYQAVIEALKWLAASTNNQTQTTYNFFLDSLLVVNQIKGLYKVKDQTLKQNYFEILNLINKLKPKAYNFTHIPRSMNSRADFLVNQTLDQLRS